MRVGQRPRDPRVPAHNEPTAALRDTGPAPDEQGAVQIEEIEMLQQQRKTIKYKIKNHHLPQARKTLRWKFRLQRDQRQDRQLRARTPHAPGGRERRGW